MRFFCCWSSCLFFVHFALACHDREYHTGTACIECFKEQFQSVTRKSYSEGCSACAMLSRYIGGFLTLTFTKGYYRLLHLGETTAIQHTRYYIPSLDPGILEGAIEDVVLVCHCLSRHLKLIKITLRKHRWQNKCASNEIYPYSRKFAFLMFVQA